MMSVTNYFDVSFDYYTPNNRLDIMPLIFADFIYVMSCVWGEG